MSTDIRLCSKCREIDFESLFYVPLDADESDDVRQRLGRWMSYNSSLLGSMASVVKWMDSCDLCAFVVETACHATWGLGYIRGRSVDGDGTSDVSDTDDDETRNERSSPVLSDETSPDLSASETMGAMAVSRKAARSREYADGVDNIYPELSNDQEDTASQGEGGAETITIHINNQPFELFLRDERPIMCNLSRAEFARLRQACWKGQRVDELSICKLAVNFNYGKKDIDVIDLHVCVDKTAGLPVKGTGREMDDLVDLSRVKGWIETCRSRHGDTCERPSWLGNMESVPGLRMIDVVGKNIVSAPPGCRYLALSYVWGQRLLSTKTAATPGQNLALTALKSNIARLGEEGGLACLALPQTIRDAMELTERLGERYLWVDALCIVQDDIEDVQRQTAVMDSVFSGAVLTIAATAGNDANHGLPGLTPGSRSNMRRKIHLTESLSLLSLANHSQEPAVWGNRGWTFQEQLLSRRILFFENNLVSWKCDVEAWDEETICELEKPEAHFYSFSVGFGGLPRTKNRFWLRQLNRYVRNYTARTLSYGSDILPAFQGVMRRYEATTGERLHWGLAYREVAIGNSLMWFTMLWGAEGF